MTETVRIDRHDGWALVTIAREAKRNAMDRATRTGLRRAFESLADEARAIVLTGSGASFCSGLDLKEREADRKLGQDDAAEDWIALNLEIRRHPAVFIAAVNGLALGGGTTLITVCDLALASTTAAIGCPEMGFATYPAMAGPGLQLSLPRKRAAWLVLTTNRLDGATAADWSLVNEAVAPEALLPRAAELAAQVARFDPVALREAKRALDEIPARISDWEPALAHGQSVNRTIRSQTDAAATGMRAFSEGKRAPGQGDAG